MKILLFAILIATNAQATLNSHFASSVEGITIPNTHLMSSDRKILRGQSPHGKVEELIDFGITDILIFKNQTRSEIDDEKKEIASFVDAKIKVKQIEFLWHDYKSYKKTCEQTIDALRYIRTVKESKNRKMFFHCTVGEDRTGFLAGLWRMLEQNWSTNKAFRKEMCENGYANGNPIKPDYVVNEIRDDLTPLFNYMSGKIKSGKLSLKRLTKSICTDKIPMKVGRYCKASSKSPRTRKP